MSYSPKTFTVNWCKMLRNKGAVYLPFHYLSKHMAFSIPNHFLAWITYKNMCVTCFHLADPGELLFCIHRLVRLVYIWLFIVKTCMCENVYGVQLSSQILFSQFHVRSFKVVRDPCQKITLLLLKSKSVRVIVTESCF